MLPATLPDRVISPPGAVEAFDFHGNQIRVIMKDGAPWFVLADLAKVMEIKNVGLLKTRLDQLNVSSAYVENTRGQMRSTVIVNKANMYRVIMRSDKPEAVKFQNWVTDVVLVELDEKGTYSIEPQPKFEIPQTLAGALKLAGEIEQLANFPVVAAALAEGHLLVLVLHLPCSPGLLPDQVGQAGGAESCESPCCVVHVSAKASAVASVAAAGLNELNRDILIGAFRADHFRSLSRFWWVRNRRNFHTAESQAEHSFSLYFLACRFRK